MTSQGQPLTLQPRPLTLLFVLCTLCWIFKEFLSQFQAFQLLMRLTLLPVCWRRELTPSTQTVSQDPLFVFWVQSLLALNHSQLLKCFELCLKTPSRFRSTFPFEKVHSSTQSVSLLPAWAALPKPQNSSSLPPYGPISQWSLFLSSWSHQSASSLQA